MIRCAVIDQDVDEAAVIAVVTEGGESCRRYEGQTVEWFLFTFGVNKYVGSRSHFPPKSMAVYLR